MPAPITPGTTGRVLVLQIGATNSATAARTITIAAAGHVGPGVNGTYVGETFTLTHTHSGSSAYEDVFVSEQGPTTVSYTAGSGNAVQVRYIPL